MKTCLYQPIFINPQAYFVFPSLYNIEKGDSFIEPANITGQLIINTLTDDPTLTPIILTVKDNNQVDFSIFAGKHIRISQYTDEGAVVLGEWLIPGESAPVYPDWFNDSLVCWYSPSKQKLTQLDVIESYDQDFTYWTINNTAITSAQKKIVIPAGTELKYVIAFRGFNSFTAGFDIKYTGNTVITYIYNKEDDTSGSITINESGIYHLPASVRAQKNFGFYCNPQTTTEEATIEILSTSILKDFSGNGLDAYMYGFQGKLNSGMGVYKFDFLSDLRINSAYLLYTERQDDKICSLAGHPAGWLFQFTSLSDIPAFKVEVKGIVNDKFTYRWYDEKGNRGVDIAINEDGIYEFPMSYSVETNTGVGIVCNNICQDNVCFTQIPDYPNQLCYSGKEYCISYNQPILTDYTVIADRTWFDKDGIFANKGSNDSTIHSLFVFENKENDKSITRTASCGYWSTVNIPDEGISWQTKSKYNNTEIAVGNVTDGRDVLTIGGNNLSGAGNWYGCHSDFLLFNRTLNEDEINWLKENIYNIEI